MDEVSLTKSARNEIKKSKETIDYFFNIGDVISNTNARDKLFKLLGI